MENSKEPSSSDKTPRSNERFFASAHCKSHAHCRACLTGSLFRERMVRAGLMDTAEFDCPEGRTSADFVEPDPTVPNLLKNFTKAMGRWVEKGFPVVSRAEYRRRIAVCRACDLWDERGYGGLGRCNHGECRCTRLKHWLETEKCPLNLW